jgi:hypothetical protein
MQPVAQTVYRVILSLETQTLLNNFSVFVWFPMKFDMYLQNKVCLEHMLKMVPSSIQALLYASLPIGEDIW